MRAGALSQPKVIRTLNAKFVPVYISNEDYREGGSATAEERAELQRIHQEGYRAKLSVGSVHAFVLNPTGSLLDTLHVAEATPERLLALLKKTANGLGTPEGKPLVEAKLPPPPKAKIGESVLHIVARYLERRGDAYVLTVGERGNWSDLPAEEWVTLKASQTTALLPKEAVVLVGTEWSLSEAASEPFLTHFYPPTENNALAKNRFLERTLRGRIVSVNQGVATATLTGKLSLKHPFYHKEDANIATADLIGTLEFHVASRHLRSLQITTDNALYGDSLKTRQHFGVALRLLP